MRWSVTEIFKDLVVPYLPEIQSVAIVGGSPRDPEVQWLRSAQPSCQFHYFGVAELTDVRVITLDLNETTWTPEVEDFAHSIDLVHCAHVLEHVWDVRTACENLLNLLRPDGLAWINCPASSMAHGSPAYYSAGYQPELLTQLLEQAGATTVSSGRVGSPRSYFYEHTLRRWPDQSEFESPLLHMSSGRGGKLRGAARWAKYFPERLAAQCISKAPGDDPRTATQTYVLSQQA